MAMRIYLAGPLSGSMLGGRRDFEEARTELQEAGYRCLVPSEAVPRDAGLGEVARASLRDLLACGGVALLPGWDRSGFAKLEETVAVACGIPCGPVSWWVDIARRRGGRPGRAGAAS